MRVKVLMDKWQQDFPAWAQFKFFVPAGNFYVILFI
jgi:hypothetical protein